GPQIVKALWKGYEVVIKKCDIYNQHAVVAELEHEAKIYEELQELQGECIPTLWISGVANGLEMILVTEFVGTNVSQERLDDSDRAQIQQALCSIHELGVVHGDIRLENIVQSEDTTLQLFSESPDDNRYILVQRPLQVHTPIPARASIPISGYLSDSSRPGDLRVDIEKIADMFFATGSKHAEFLESYVQGQLLFLRTTSGMGGLPKVLRRGVVESQYSKPNLLFLDLSDPPPSAGVPVPERFGVSVILLGGSFIARRQISN
ncbi:hypothetical protein BG003_010103, partial [Podila horticola]